MTTTVPPTDHADVSASDAVSDSQLGRDILFGMAVGTPLTFAVMFVLSLVAGLSLTDAAGVAALPCVLSGVFFGGVIPLSRQMARHERLELADRSRG